jgi:hypothetical protein
MNRRIRTLLSTSVLAATLAGAAVAATAAPAGALAVRHQATSCTEGATKTDQWGNVWLCEGGKWVLWSMPALTLRTMG